MIVHHLLTHYRLANTSRKKRRKIASVIIDENRRKIYTNIYYSGWFSDKKKKKIEKILCVAARCSVVYESIFIINATLINITSNKPAQPVEIILYLCIFYCDSVFKCNAKSQVERLKIKKKKNEKLLKKLLFWHSDLMIIFFFFWEKSTKCKNIITNSICVNLCWNILKYLLFYFSKWIHSTFVVMCRKHTEYNK